MKKLEIHAAAKINLFLDILGRLDNGYHSLCMLMQSVSLYDRVTLEKTEGGGLAFVCDDASLPTDAGNLAVKGARAFLDAAGITDACVCIRLEKQIPKAAGLAGGSADAAAVIAGLDRLYETNFSTARLCEIGLRVGSDVPFCLTGGTMLAQNTGEILSPLPPLAPCSILIAKPAQDVSTAAAYSAFDAAEKIHRPNTLQMLDAAARGDFARICRYSANVFEQVVEVPQRVEIKRIMRGCGAVLAQMSGSGPSIFGLFKNPQNAKNCTTQLEALEVETFFCNLIEKSLAFSPEDVL